MYANSRAIFSRQNAPHEGLERQLRRHAAMPFRRPVAAPARAIYQLAMAEWTGLGGGRPLILDAGCGVGWSTMRLARMFPDHWVIGVDKSEDRLLRRKAEVPAESGSPAASLVEGCGALPVNARLVRADLVDFWCLLAADGVRLARHYLLYPNPWPKIGHLARRWHGHAVFPELLHLGGILECRSNWRIYVEELALAVRCLTGREAPCTEHFAADPWTPFERKYRDSGQALYRFAVDLDR